MELSLLEGTAVLQSVYVAKSANPRGTMCCGQVKLSVNLGRRADRPDLPAAFDIQLVDPVGQIVARKALLTSTLGLQAGGEFQSVSVALVTTGQSAINGEPLIVKFSTSSEPRTQVFPRSNPNILAHLHNLVAETQLIFVLLCFFQIMLDLVCLAITDSPTTEEPVESAFIRLLNPSFEIDPVEVPGTSIPVITFWRQTGSAGILRPDPEDIIGQPPDGKQVLYIQPGACVWQV